MALTQRDLAREVASIVACRYPPSLAKLADICASLEPVAIGACLLDRPPCTVAKLASIVSAALPLWRPTIVLLSSLAHSPEFAHALLLQEPGLLDALLARAVSSDDAFEEYARLCVTILSRPLPESVPLPASAQSFLLAAFERAIRNPHVETLDPVYCMLNGACRGLVRTLPPESRQLFDANLKHILSSSSTGQDSMLVLWCFGITILAEHPEATEASPALRWETAAGRKLFDSDVNKTIDLASLNVLWVANGHVDVSDAEALQGIRIATQTLRFVDEPVRLAWPTSGDLAQKTFAQLPSKILRRGIDPAVQLAALSFYAVIAGANNLPADLVKEYETALPQLLTRVDSGFLEESLSTSLPLFAPQMEEHSVQALLSPVLTASVSATSAHELSNAKILVGALTAIIPYCTELCVHVLSASVSTDMQEALQRFFRVNVTRLEHEGQPSCRSNAAVVCCDLVLEIVCLLVGSGFSFGLPMPRPLATLTGSNIGQSPTTCHRCNHPAPSTNLRPVSLFQQECTPPSGVHLQDWRKRLTSEMENQAFYQRDSVMRSVTQICRDLESRCQTVEERLRREKEKSTRLEEEVHELRQALAPMEAKMCSSSEHARAVDLDNKQFEKEKDQATAELERVTQEFDDTNAKVEKTLREAQDGHSTTEAPLRSTILAREEDVRAREQELQELHTTAARLHERGYLLARKYDKTFALTRTINRLDEENAHLKTHLHNTELELTAFTGRLDDLQERHDELAQSSTEALEDLERKYEQEMAGRGSLASSLQERNKTLDELRIATSLLRANAQRLENVHMEQDAEREELQTWKNRVLASMDLPSDPTRTRAVSCSTDEANHPCTPPRQHRQRKSALQTQGATRKALLATQVSSSNAIAAVANASFTLCDSHSSLSGSTPKRLKPGSSFRVSKSVSRRLSPAKRSAWRPNSPNRRHATVGVTIPENEGEPKPLESLPVGGRWCSLQDIEPADSDVNGFMVGTPFTPEAFTSGTERLSDDDGPTAEL